MIFIFFVEGCLSYRLLRILVGVSSSLVPVVHNISLMLRYDCVLALELVLLPE